jgi:DNA-binding NarL/FixJ family response regulator
MEKIKVSIVEDIEEVRESIDKLLQGSDEFTLISSFENAEQAEKSIPFEQPDIVIMDISLPGKTGIECLRKIKDKCAGTQFMMYTIFEDDEKVFQALEAGASGYLLKKTPKEKITEALKELHEGGSPMSTQIARKVIQAFQRRKEISEEEKSLTKKEKEVLDLLAKGFLYKEIADQLSITINTVKQHIHTIYEKLHVTNKAEAISKVYVKK